MPNTHTTGRTPPDDDAGPDTSARMKLAAAATAVGEVDWTQPTQPVEVAAAVLGIGRSSAYKAVASGELPHVRIGSRIVVPTTVLRRMVCLDLDPSND